jgi:hypothetical protein
MNLIIKQQIECYINISGDYDVRDVEKYVISLPRKIYRKGDTGKRGNIYDVSSVSYGTELIENCTVDYSISTLRNILGNTDNLETVYKNLSLEVILNIVYYHLPDSSPSFDVSTENIQWMSRMGVIFVVDTYNFLRN